MKTVKMKKGKYYVGDPCYIFDESWDKVLEETNYFSDGECDLFGYKIFADSTAYGDGTYKDNKGNEYYVDSGTIGALPIELIDIDNCYSYKDIQKSKGMRIVNFKEDFECSIYDGVFTFGHIVIDTY